MLTNARGSLVGIPKTLDNAVQGPEDYRWGGFPGRGPEMDYAPQESYAEASEFLANYHHARQILEEICEINRELLRRRGKL